MLNTNAETSNMIPNATIAPEPQASNATVAVVLSVPEGVQPGQQIQATPVVNGVPVQVMVLVPPGLRPGDQFKVEVNVPQAQNNGVLPHVPTVAAVPVGIPVMNREAVPNDPYGLCVDKISKACGFEVFQVFHGIELIGWEKQNRYKIHESVDPALVQGNADLIGPQIMFAQEKSDMCERQLCGPQRHTSLTFHVGDDNTGAPVATWEKPFHLQQCCCMRPQCTVKHPSGDLVATVSDPFKCCDFTQTIRDHNGTPIYEIYGPCCQLGQCCPCISDITFTVRETSTNQVVGSVSKKFNGCAELMTQVNRFQIRFPVAAPVNHKLALLGALFLLDFEYFEKQK